MSDYMDIFDILPEEYFGVDMPQGTRIKSLIVVEGKIKLVAILPDASNEWERRYFKLVPVLSDLNEDLEFVYIGTAVTADKIPMSIFEVVSAIDKETWEDFTEHVDKATDRHYYDPDEDDD